MTGVGGSGPEAAGYRRCGGHGRVAASLVTLTVVAAIAAGGCSAAYYGAWEKLGRHERELLRDGVESARDAQGEAATQFADALTRLQALYGHRDGDLERLYHRPREDHDRSSDDAERVRGRISKVEKVAGDLFAEWQDEIEPLSSPDLCRRSRHELHETSGRCREMHAAMKQAEASMEPAPVRFRDHVLSLEHNLNSQAIGSVAGEAVEVEADARDLVASMRGAIAAADVFLATMPR